MNLKVITYPANSPIKLDLVKDYLRIDYGEEDALIQGMINAAISHTENFTRRSLSIKTYELTLNKYKNRVKLPKPPFVSLDSVKDENLQPIEHVVLEEDGTAFVVFENSFEKAIITYQSGYEEMPKPIEQAILMLVSHFYENRELAIVGTSVVKLPFSVEALLYPYKGWF
ncbi:phage gp6-like head-tail connector protein [Virgibacillus halodenitrificans]|uniref:head-tail connector protein n=1 Tax=Virgibacillus halodenitrificans TaxID=1482 RepID=UPI001EEEC19C|nr:head-tail connector protein [Virgibacillus halodenitrificans]MCG1029308.1 phage gp6-like head-tail connector protein [Virgibacillus halodenitrificans]